MTQTTFGHLVVDETAAGPSIPGFISGETQARIAFTRRGQPMEIVCLTEGLACAQLAAIDSLSGWDLVSATLEPCRPSRAQPVPAQVS